MKKLPSSPKKGPFNALKGMRDITNEEYYKYQGFFEKAQDVAIYYGFSPIELPVLEREEVFTTGLGAGTDVVEKEMYTLKTRSGDHLTLRPEGTAGIMRAYIEHGMQSLPQPVSLYYYGQFFRHDRPQRGRFREFRQFGLEILGSARSAADAMLIRTTITILEEAGVKNFVLSINSIGDKDCRPNYIKELTNYYKKHVNSLCADCRERLKNNPLRLLDCKEERCIALKTAAPDAVAYLCAPCKAHFKEVLEYLEGAGIAYEIDKTVVRGFNYYTRTVFEIKEPKVEGAKESPLSIASGGRYDYLGKELGAKKDVPAVGVGLGVDRIISSPSIKHLTPRVIKKPKVYFIQLGFEAKMKSLKIIEILRKARVPVVQSLSKDNLGAQLGTAEKSGIPYVIIFGQKEAMEGSVIVRNMENRSQDTVPLATLPDYIKNIK